MTKTVPPITTGAMPASRKIHLPGNLHDIRVPLREIAISGEAALQVYDASGPYTDPAVQIDVARGLADTRGRWLQDRGEVAPYSARQVTDADNGFAAGARLTPAFAHQRPPLRATRGQAVTQLAYARGGVITPEIEYVAIR